MNAPFIQVIDNKSVALDEEPFPHKYLTDFLKPDFYSDICSLFDEILARGIVYAHDPFDKNRFKRFTYGYDAAYWQVPPDVGYPLNEFYSPQWIAYFSHLFGVNLTADISLTLHHQSQDSKPFTAHNDYCLIGMPKREDDDLRVKQYYFGSPSSGASPYFIQSVEEAEHLNLDVQMRSVVGIFYINNPPWKEGNGGETGLYDNYESYTLNRPSKRCPPISNSMLTFETSPASFHTYLPNKATVRNTLLFWLHSPYEHKIARFNHIKPTEYSYTRNTKHDE